MARPCEFNRGETGEKQEGSTGRNESGCSSLMFGCSCMRSGRGADARRLIVAAAAASRGRLQGRQGILGGGGGRSSVDAAVALVLRRGGAPRDAPHSNIIDHHRGREGRACIWVARPAPAHSHVPAGRGQTGWRGREHVRMLSKAWAAARGSTHKMREKGAASKGADAGAPSAAANQPPRPALVAALRNVFVSLRSTNTAG